MYFRPLKKRSNPTLHLYFYLLLLLFFWSGGGGGKWGDVIQTINMRYYKECH